MGQIGPRKGDMRYFCLIFLSLSIDIYGFETVQFGDNSFHRSVWDSLKKEEYYSKSQVNSQKDKQQSLNFQSMGLHTVSCQIALVKISRYEYYSQFLSFVKQSSYDDKARLISLTLSHSLMPFDMDLSFKLDRVEKPGVYPFVFEGGFLKGLNGEIQISEFSKRCFFNAVAKWQGPDTKIPNTVFEFFTQVLGQLTLKNLFRISKTMTF